MRDDVVELARDARALGEEQAALLRLGLTGLGLAPAALRIPERERDRDAQEQEREPTRPEARVPRGGQQAQAGHDADADQVPPLDLVPDFNFFTLR